MAFQSPSTPDRRSLGRGRSNFGLLGDEPSTTPAGPPPSTSASFTPAGAPSASYMGSSMMRGVTTAKSVNFGDRNPGSSSKNLFGRASGDGSALGHSVRGGSRGLRQPSRLSKATAVDEDNDSQEDEAETDTAPRTFEVRYDDDDDDDDDSYDDDAEGEEEDEMGHVREATRYEADAMEDEADGMPGAGGDMWLDMDQALATGMPTDGDGSDLMMFATPAADDRIRREAEDIFRASSMRSGGRRRHFDYAAAAKSLYEQPQMQYASVTEPPDVVLGTEHLIDRLYEEGVGAADDDERLDDTLAGVAGQVTSLWKKTVENMPQPQEEHAAGIGPGPHATPFERAAYLATFVLRVHHTRCDEYGRAVAEPLPETMFRWLSDSHNLYPNQVQDVLRHKPSPASHGLYWQTVFVALLRGRVGDAQTLLKLAGWEHVKRRPRGENQYIGRALDNVQRAVHDTCAMLDGCPGKNGNWDIYSSDWTLFRIRTKGALNQLTRFAEGKDRALGESGYGGSAHGRSMAVRAREAESQVPWEIYENLNIIFDIALGTVKRILDTAQDWCEATIGLFAWWDEGQVDRHAQAVHSQSLVLANSQSTEWESYLDRLSRAFHVAVREDFQVNTMNAVEVGMACVFEDNARAVIGILRCWSLPVASAVAEIASLGRWLPPHYPSALSGMDDLDMDDLEVLGVDPGSPDEADGIKDNTLIQYAQELINYDQLSTVPDKSGNARDGWELAIHVLGRMDSPERSEETVGELVRTIVRNIDAESGETVEKLWYLLNDLGMIALAEDVAQHYGGVLAESSHRYGEAMWYYALAHRPNKIREVVSLLISYCLIQSIAYPQANELDLHLARLLKERTATLETLARQDLEAAELMGKMLSGYATVRKFYDIRDDENVPLVRRKRAAAATIAAVIASSDDNIRGGLYDASRDAVVSECFLLSLLGEALVFVNKTGEKPVISLDQVDVLLKAVEDIETVGPRIFNASDEFFNLVLASAPGMKGSTPADLMRKSSSGLGGSSFAMTGSSMLASQIHRTLGGGGLQAKAGTRRGWDWRSGLHASTKSRDVLEKLRLGLTKDLARLWLERADGGW